MQYTTAKGLKVGQTIQHNDRLYYKILAVRNVNQFIEFDLKQIGAAKTLTITATPNDTMILIVA